MWGYLLLAFFSYNFGKKTYLNVFKLFVFILVVFNFIEKVLHRIESSEAFLLYQY